MFGQRLKDVRKSKNKTQKEMAIELKISEPRYSNYEKGKREPDYSTLLEIANQLDVSIDYLLGNKKEIEKTPITDIEIQQILIKKTKNSDFHTIIETCLILNDKELKVIKDLLMIIKK